MYLHVRSVRQKTDQKKVNFIDYSQDQSPKIGNLSSGRDAAARGAQRRDASGLR
jgi:hypothetical protein